VARAQIYLPAMRRSNEPQQQSLRTGRTREANSPAAEKRFYVRLTATVPEKRSSMHASRDELETCRCYHIIAIPEEITLAYAVIFQEFMQRGG
jgi:hypothetical protein